MLGPLIVAAALLGAAAIPPATLPPWQPNACADSAAGELDQPNVRITDLTQNGTDVVVKFRIELFAGDPDFPNRGNRGMIFVQLDNERGTYLAARTRPEEDSAVAYAGLSKGPHRVAIQLVTSADVRRRSTAIRCFTVR
jgi:hypothetical protein